MTQKWLFSIIAVILVTMTACSGSLKGIMRKDTSRVSFSYSDSRIGKAELQVVLPEGERFKGRSEKGINLTSPKVSATTSMDRFEAVETFQGNAEAVLSGDRGNIMQCRFLLTDTILGFKGGGFGICQLSDGRVVDVFY
jgi:hypothetical protein